MPYTRWGMTEADAVTLTGTAGLTEADLTAAEDDLVDVIGWTPDPAVYPAADEDVRVRAFGRAVAWQAAYRSGTARTADDGSGARVSSESIDNYSVTYADGGLADRPILAPRARRLLTRAGWYRLAGRTAGSGVTRQAFDDWQRNRV